MIDINIDEANIYIREAKTIAKIMDDLQSLHSKLRRIKDAVSDKNPRLILKYYDNVANDWAYEEIACSDEISQTIVKHYENESAKLVRRLDEHTFKTIEAPPKRVNIPKSNQEFAW